MKKYVIVQSFCLASLFAIALAKSPILANNKITDTLASQTLLAQRSDSEIKEFITEWGNAWSTEEKASEFTRESFAPFYLQSDELLAFDFTDAESQTVFKGVENHHSTWEAFVKDYNYWTFTPVAESIRVYPQSEDAAAATLYVDNYGRKLDGTEFEARAHATILLERRDGDWVIIHENIWGPVNE